MIARLGMKAQRQMVDEVMIQVQVSLLIFCPRHACPVFVVAA
jgi:hypothetical protein